MAAEDAVFSIQRTGLLKKAPLYVLGQIGLDADNIKSAVKVISSDEFSITLGKKYSPELVIAMLSSPFTEVVDKTCSSDDIPRFSEYPNGGDKVALNPDASPAALARLSATLLVALPRRAHAGLLPRFPR